MKVVDVERKSRVLTKAQFGCLSDTYTINVTQGCEFQCVYCYARGYPEAPAPGSVHLYRNLPEKLVRELDNPRRRSVVDWVVFNTASDSFQAHPDILDVTYRTMEALLHRGIGFSFLTKGSIPPRFIQLFSHHPERVLPRVGLVSMSPRYRDLFEPAAATAAERLRNIERLQLVGIDVEVRIDPIIPFCTDDEVSIREVYEALAARDVQAVSLSYLHLRPAILEQLRRELPPTEFNVVLSCFRSQPWSTVGSSTRSKLIPLPLRRRGYERFLGLAKKYGIEPLICACKNPDVPSQRCTAAPPAGSPERRQGGDTRQLSLFPCDRF